VHPQAAHIDSYLWCTKKIKLLLLAPWRGKEKNESFLLALFISESQLATNLWHPKYNKLFVSRVLTERGRGISDFTTTRDLGNAIRERRGCVGVAAPDINFSLSMSQPRCEENKNVSISHLKMIC
jgi:hypothetical protein